MKNRQTTQRTRGVAGRHLAKQNVFRNLVSHARTNYSTWFEIYRRLENYQQEFLQASIDKKLELVDLLVLTRHRSDS
jgi:hypothetical protein